MKKLLLLVLLSQLAFAGGSKRPVPSPTPVARPSPAASPSPNPHVGAGPLVAIGKDVGPNVNLEFALEALDLLNSVYWNGCLRKKIISHEFKSLHSVLPTDAKTNEEAYQRYVGGAPYTLDLRWYYKKLSKVIGYTYNFLSDTWGEAPDGASETHIWSNTKYINLSYPAGYASHLSHELSHQARAGGFVHYSFFTGSFPYDVGDIVMQCILEL